MSSHRVVFWFVPFLVLFGGCASDNVHSETEALLRVAPEVEVVAAAGAGSRARLESPLIECDDAVPRRLPGTCEPTEPNSPCQACVQAKCCEEQTACNESFPDRACAFGSTLYDGRQVEGGEIACMLECLAGRTLRDAASEAENLRDCSAACAASECGDGGVSVPTAQLANCIAGSDTEAGGCSYECGLVP